MYLSKSEQETLRSLCKDEDTYAEVLNFLKQKKSAEEQIVEHLSTPVMLVDAAQDDHPIVYVNPAFEALSGYQRKDISGKNPRFLQEADREQTELEKMREAIRSEHDVTATVRNYRRDGSLFWNRITMMPIRDKDGNLTHFMSTHVDVTEELESNQKTQLIDDIYGYFIDNTLDMITIYAPDGRLIYANPAVTKTLGYTIGELREMSPADRVHPDDLDYTQNQVHQDVLDGKTVSQVEYRLQKKDGNYIQIEAYSTPIYNHEGTQTHLLAISRDISERAHRSEQQFRTLVENNPDLIQRLDLEGRFLYVNPALEKAFGLPAEEIIGKTGSELGIADELIYLFQKAGQTVYDTGKEEDIEFTIDSTGRHLIFQGRLVPEFDTEGNVETILAIVRDVTKLKKAEHDLLKNEAMLRKAQEIGGIGSWEYYFDTDKSIWSDEFFRICGLEPQSVRATGELGFSIIHPDDRERARLATQQSQDEGRPYNIEKRLVRPDGEIRYVESRGEVIQDQETGSLKLVGTFHDITERKLTELAWQESEARANALLDAIPDMVFHLSQEGKFLDVQAKPEDLYAPDIQLIGTMITDYFEPKLNKQIVDAISKTLDRHELQTIEYQLNIPERGLRDYEARFVPGGENEVTAIVRDVTNERQIREHRLRVAIERERTTILSQFIQMASHEFRTPLSVITMNLHMLLQLNDETKRKQKIERINKQLLQINNLIDMQLLMTKLDSGITMRRLPLSVSEVINQVLTKLDGKLSKKNIEVQQDIMPVNLTIAADDAYFQDALSQILDNAIRYSNDGDNIYIRARRTDSSLFIAVEDKGIGIAEEDMEHLFERFWRKDKSQTAAGSGLGLPLAQKVIELHGGEIEVSSELNQGSVFTIKLPIQ